MHFASRSAGRKRDLTAFRSLAQAFDLRKQTGHRPCCRQGRSTPAGSAEVGPVTVPDLVGGVGGGGLVDVGAGPLNGDFDQAGGGRAVGLGRVAGQVLQDAAVGDQVLLDDLDGASARDFAGSVPASVCSSLFNSIM